MKADSTHREINATMKLMESWELLKDLSPTERETILNQLKQIAYATMQDQQQLFNSSRIELENSLQEVTIDYAKPTKKTMEDWELLRIKNIAKMYASTHQENVEGTSKYHSIRNRMYDDAIEKDFFDDTDDNFEEFDKFLGESLNVEFFDKGITIKKGYKKMSYERY
tara:strand:- start:47 stop:547 length:501 start_codon:yes stop_codon:yes gene_type:complete